MRNKPFAWSSLILLLVAGCNSDPTPGTTGSKPPNLSRPDIASVPSTQPSQTVAQMQGVTVNKTELDALLYDSYGLRMLFDIVELDLAKSMLAKQGKALEPADVQRERQLILAKICGDAPQSSYEDLFNQFLEREHLSRAEFDLKVIQTNAALRKIVEPVIVGKLTEATLHKGYEQLYGAKRQIADIELANALRAQIALSRLKTEPFEKVAQEMSIDNRTSAKGGVWPPFSATNSVVPKEIVSWAFTLEKGQISDILQAGQDYHIIKVLDVIEPTIVKFEDVKQDVRKQMEDQAIEATIKDLRDQLTAAAQHQLKIEDPLLSAQWDALAAQAHGRQTDRNSALKQMNDAHAHATTTPTTNP